MKNPLLQYSSSSLMEQLYFFHDHALLVLVIITILVGQLMLGLFSNEYINRYLMEGPMIELIRTILPAITLIFIAVPSLKLIYILDEVNNPSISIKPMGHQWYWSYECSDIVDIEFEYYVIPSNQMNSWNFRLLDVDKRAVIPFESQIRMLVSSADVIHSSTIPSMGVKIDATPGRLNQIKFTSTHIGLFYGQCSEIWGVYCFSKSFPKLFSKWMFNITM